MNVFIVDTDRIFLKRISKAIRKRGHQVKTCWSVHTVPDTLCGSCFDLMLVNAGLRGKGGSRLIEECRLQHPEIRIIAVADHADERMEIEARRWGIIYYMVKPVRISELEQIVLHIQMKIIKKQSV